MGRERRTNLTTGQRPKAALREIVDVRLSSVDKKTKSGEIPVRLCNYTDVYNNNFIKADMEFMPATGTDREIENCTLYTGDVVITKDSETDDDIGVPALVRENMPDLVCGYHLAILRPNPSKVDGTYLFYALGLTEAQHQFHSYANGITRFGLRKTDIGLVEIPLPTLPEQRDIAHILGTLDDKIELNRRMNQTLEAMARGIFQDWFVDFGPVRVKMEGHDPYLPPALWDLFPDDMVVSEVGEIPEGWEIIPLSKVSNINPESWSSKNKPDGVEYVDLANTKWGVIESTQYFPWKEAPSRARRVLRPGDTLVGTVRPANGSYSFVGNDGLTGSTGFAVLRPSHPLHRELVFLSATAPENIDRLSHLADGAAYPAVRPETVGETELAMPISNPGVLDWFSRIIGPILEKMETNKTESQLLAAHRDALLPRLVSGEASVSLNTWEESL